jgi:hypothetical protein
VRRNVDQALGAEPTFGSQTIDGSVDQGSKFAIPCPEAQDRGDR